MNKRIIKKTAIRQQEIVESARKIISTYGISRLTIREIANDLKLTEGALYRHFKSKKEIIGLLIEEIENTLLATIESAAKVADNPLGKLENILLSHLSYAEKRRGVSFIIINESLNLHDKTLRNKMLSAVEKYLDKIKEILIEGIKSGEFKDSLDIDSASIAFFGMVQSLVTVWALTDYKSHLKEKRIKALFDIYKNGIIF